jgi:SNF2 family DNA or RNA helicase
VFIIQTKSGGQGLNLQEATRVYITTPAWNPATELQAIGRSHRTGQTKTVKVSKLIYTGYDDIPSIEQTIMMLQGHKSKVCAEVLNDDTLLSQIPVTNRKKLKIADLKGIFNINKPKVS